MTGNKLAVSLKLESAEENAVASTILSVLDSLGQQSKLALIEYLRRTYGFEVSLMKDRANLKSLSSKLKDTFGEVTAGLLLHQMHNELERKALLQDD